MNKGDAQTPNNRSRLVAGQLKAQDKSGETYFVPPPLLEALRAVLSRAMAQIGDHKPIWEPDHPNWVQLSSINATRLHFNAKIDQGDKPTFVALLSEQPDCASMCGQRLRYTYGTRGAADVWQEECSTMLIGLGF